MGIVAGVAPGGLRSPASSPPGAHLVPSAHIVMVDQVSGAGFGTHTGSNGSFSLSVPPGTYRMSIADNDDDRGQTDCAATAGTPCGHLILTQIVTVPAGRMLENVARGGSLERSSPVEAQPASTTKAMRTSHGWMPR